MSNVQTKQLFEVGLAAHRARRFLQAEQAYRRVLEQEPAHADALYLLEGLLHQAGRESELVNTRVQDSVEEAQRGVAARPGDPVAHHALAVAQYAIGQRQAAIASWRTAIDLDPTFFKAHNDLGALFDSDGLSGEAELHLREAIRLAPQFAIAVYNLGLLHARQGRYAEAIQWYRRAIAIDSALPSAHLNLALMLLTTGDFPTGLAEYEWRWKMPRMVVNVRTFDEPEWRGQEIAGKTILLHAEQGLGDTIQMARYCEVLADRGARVVLSVQPPLVSLLRSVPGAAEVIGEDPGRLMPAFDVHAPMLSLPYLLGTTVETIPARQSYVYADPSLTAVWREAIAGDKRSRVGIAWAGQPHHHNDHNRSFSLRDFAPLLRLAGGTFYSLQKGPAAEQIHREPLGMLLVNCGHLLNDFSDTAALVANLDLVISVDTSLVHLAGAIGRPVWTLVPFVPDWRWLLERTDSPWYPSMRLFRQRQIGDLGEVMQRVSDMLKRTIQQQGQCLTNFHRDGIAAEQLK